MSTLLIYTMRSLVSRVVSISFTFYYITSPTSSAGYFSDLSRSYLTNFTALRGRDQQPGYFYNFTDFINLGALASPTSARRATSTTTSACSTSILITIKSMFELSVPVPSGQRRTSRPTLADCTCNRFILHPYLGHAPRAPRA